MKRVETDRKEPGEFRRFAFKWWWRLVTLVFLPPIWVLENANNLLVWRSRISFGELCDTIWRGWED